ncbi:alpha/beta hydrolase [Aphanothece hegewaldii CCALA 016]|uniref:Alpha/beta hydrolase n=1 Tax=Aphanothece hegewaldii CCALA 016 TaxID=2107694 RepID=A0A2T1LZY0_9CHRO|nr:alpha/beta hydrolase [Aphanothece hegewaldii]PSF37953.1 alpha/beta hydrolase [Aphanothece hegewaldii CCALA 016]
MNIQTLLLVATTIYQILESWVENQKPLPGKRIDVGGYYLHYYIAGNASPTIVIDHSLGGVEGYLLVEELAKLTKVCIYDRAGYGWSAQSPYPRTSEQIVKELDTLLTQARITPPYILVGDSFGSYNVRLYAHQFPEKVIGMVLTDGLHETAMLKMPIQLKALKYFFISGFVMSILGALLGIIRLLKTIGIFELIKPELRQFSPDQLYPIKRSFCRPQHWITMIREMLNLDISSEQLKKANQFGSLPIVSIKAKHFFNPSIWTSVIPLQATNRLREKMHDNLLTLSSDCIQLEANQSSHFIWTDQPHLILTAVKMILEKLS